MFRKFKFNLQFIVISVVLLANVAVAQDFKIYTLELGQKTKQYIVGEEWSRKFVGGALTSTEVINKLIKATARVDLKTDQGTAFYLGKFNDQHLMLTNYHVMSNRDQCKTGKVYFEYFKKSFRCRMILDKFKDFESTFFTISISKDDEYLFENAGLKFDFKNEYKPGHKVVTVGYGTHLNDKNLMTYENSQTCVVATSSKKSNFLKVKKDGTTYGAYSFAHACEISPGDSGSALMSETSEKVIGLNWATSEKKPEALRNSHNVFDWIEKDVPELWGSLSYAVSAENIQAALLGTQSPTLREFVKNQD